MISADGDTPASVPLPADAPPSRWFPACTGSLWQISQAGARQAVWHPSGRRIFYVSRDLKVVAVDLKSSGPTLSVGAARVLAETRAGGFAQQHPDRGGRRSHSPRHGA